MFEETFITWSLSYEYKHQKVYTFHAVRQNGRSIEDYEAYFYTSVHHVCKILDPNPVSVSLIFQPKFNAQTHIFDSQLNTIENIFSELKHDNSEHHL